MEKSMLIAEPERVVLDKINDYFGTAKHTVEVQMIGRMANVVISYEDFKPVRKVRRDIEDMLNNVEISSIERNYSDSSYLMIMDELIGKEQNIYIEESDGTLKRTSLLLLLDEELYHRTIN